MPAADHVPLAGGEDTRDEIKRERPLLPAEGEGHPPLGEGTSQLIEA